MRLPMVNSSKFRMEQNRDDDHQEDAPHFTFLKFMKRLIWYNWGMIITKNYSLFLMSSNVKNFDLKLI